MDSFFPLKARPRLSPLARIVRNIAFFCVGLILGGWSVWSIAETVPANFGNWDGPLLYKWSSILYPSVSSACSALNLTQCSDYPSGCCSGSGVYQKSPSAACEPGGWPVTVSGVKLCRYQDKYYCPSDGGWVLDGQTCTRPDCAPGETRDENGVCQSSCPDGEIQEGDQCVCPFRYARGESGACEPKCPYEQGFRPPASRAGASGTGSIPGSACVDNCVFPTGLCVGLGGSWHCDLGASTGETCRLSSDPPGPEPDPEDPPPPPSAEPLAKDSPEYDCMSKGMAYGTVNGQTVCVPASETKSPKNTVDTTVTHPDNTVGTESETTETKCVGSKCTTTTTTTVTGGGVTGDKPDGVTVKETESVDPCRENPNSPGCRDSNFSGSCTSEPVCEGDAVTCAIARATWVERCAVEELKTDSAVSDLFDAQNPAGDAAFQALSVKALNKDGAHDFDFYATFQEKRQNYVNFTATCPANGLGFTFQGRRFDFDTDFVCQLGEFVRLLMHIAAYMIVARLLSRTFA